MEREHNSENELRHAQEMEAWFAEYVFDDEAEPGRLSRTTISRLVTLYGKGDKHTQLRQATETLFRLPDADQQAAFAMYLCGYGEDVISKIAIGDLGETLQAVEAIVKPHFPGERERKVGKRGLRFDDIEAPVDNLERPILYEETEEKEEPEDEPDEQLPGVRLSNDPVYDYLRAIGRHELLTAEQEVELAQKIEAGLFAQEKLEMDSDSLSAIERRELSYLAREGKRAKDKMLTSNLRLVVRYAKGYMRRGMPFLDIIQEGNAGLVRAVEKFDYQKGFKFSTYATWWIKQSITRALADKGSLVRLPVHVGAEVNKIYKTQSTMLTDLGREPTDEELSRELDMTVEKLNELRSYRSPVISLNQTVGEESDTEFGDLVYDESSQSVDDAVEGMVMKGDIETVITEVLGYRDAQVLRHRLGLDGEEPKTLDAVAEILDLSRERIRQIESKAMQRLRTDPYALRRLSDYRDIV